MPAVRRLGATTLAGPATVAQPGDVASMAVAADHLDGLEQVLEGSSATEGMH